MAGKVAATPEISRGVVELPGNVIPVLKGCLNKRAYREADDVKKQLQLNGPVMWQSWVLSFAPEGTP